MGLIGLSGFIWLLVFIVFLGLLVLLWILGLLGILVLLGILGIVSVPGECYGLGIRRAFNRMICFSVPSLGCSWLVWRTCRGVAVRTCLRMAGNVANACSSVCCEARCVPLDNMLCQAGGMSRQIVFLCLLCTRT